MKTTRYSHFPSPVRQAAAMLLVVFFFSSCSSSSTPPGGSSSYCRILQSGGKSYTLQNLSYHFIRHGGHYTLFTADINGETENGMNCSLTFDGVWTTDPPIPTFTPTTTSGSMNFGGTFVDFGLSPSATFTTDCGSGGVSGKSDSVTYGVSFSVCSR